jgi:hypothetical protein
MPRLSSNWATTGETLAAAAKRLVALGSVRSKCQTFSVRATRRSPDHILFDSVQSFRSQISENDKGKTGAEGNILDTTHTARSSLQLLLISPLCLTDQRVQLGLSRFLAGTTTRMAGKWFISRSAITKSPCAVDSNYWEYRWPDCRCPQTHKEDFSNERSITCDFVGSGCRWGRDPGRWSGGCSSRRPGSRLHELWPDRGLILRLRQGQLPRQIESPLRSQTFLRLRSGSRACLHHLRNQFVPTQLAGQAQELELQETRLRLCD